MIALKTNFKKFISCSGFYNSRRGWSLIPIFVVSLISNLQCDASDLALVGAKIYLSPFTQPIEKGTIIVSNGHILAVGPVATVKIPHGSTVIDCKGLIVTAGFWNSHVHILLPELLYAEKLSSDKITSQL